MSSHEVLLKLALSLHRWGAPAHRLEAAMQAASDRLGVEAGWFASPTALLVATGPQGRQHTDLLRVGPGDVDLARLADTDGVAADLASGAMRPADALEALRRIEARPDAWGPWATWLAFGTASAAAAVFFGGGAPEIAAASVSGLVIGALAQRSPALGAVFLPVAAAASVLAAGTAAHLGAHGPTVALSGLVVLVPGFSLTVAMIELSTRHWISGTARLAGAAVSLVQLALGAALARLVLGPIPDAPHEPAPPWALPMALVAVSAAFAVLLRARPRDLPWIAGAAGVAFGASRVGAIDPLLGAATGAFAVSVASNVWSRFTGRPAVVTLTPGLLLLVPGTLGYSGVDALVDGDTVGGVRLAVDALAIAAALAGGTLAGQAIGLGVVGQASRLPALTGRRSTRGTRRPARGRTRARRGRRRTARNCGR